MRLLTNNAESKLAGQIGVTDTVLTFFSGDGNLFPPASTADGTRFDLTIYDANGNIEICLATIRNNDLVTVTRGTQNTLAREWPAGTRVDGRPTAAYFSEQRDLVNTAVQAAQSAVNGLADETAARQTAEAALQLAISRASHIGDMKYVSSPTTANLETNYPGWVRADGRTLSRTTYAALYAVIGTTFGQGDGATTFAIPKSDGIFLRSSDLINRFDSGRVVGSEQLSANLSHNHGVSDPGHAHGVYDPGHNHGYSTLPPFTRTGELAGSGSTGYMVGSPNFNGYATDISGSNIAIYAALSQISIVASGATESRPVNLSLHLMIKIQ